MEGFVLYQSAHESPLFYWACYFLEQKNSLSDKLLALINLLFAGFLIALDLSYNEIHLRTLWWSLLKLSTAAIIITIGIIVWLEVTGAIRPTLVLLGSVFLIALGPSTIDGAGYGFAVGVCRRIPKIDCFIVLPNKNVPKVYFESYASLAITFGTLSIRANFIK
jgi:hypothetical protein